jgi:hypothetical protein
MINQKYYYEDPKYEKIFKKYITLWNGYLKGNKEKWFKKEDYTKASDIITEICDINFYRHHDEDHLYLSLDADENYYYDSFEKHIFKMIKKLEKECNIFIESAEFYAFECKHFGNQYKYNIDRNKDKNNKIILKKKILNWDKLNKE